ncbi:MAG: threonylcarbamoyl-AMP synthase, partial [Clostridiales bacterium]|nr:threonylcarbamoyl-AMP synthase [Clostridiales bacterium]
MLEQVLGQVDEDETMFRADTGQAPKAPGMKYRHYAPKGELTIVQGGADDVLAYINGQVAADIQCGHKVGVIATDELYRKYSADVVKSIGSRNAEDDIARNLYRILREFDEEQVTRIYSEGFATEGFGQAIMNRLLKAAGHKVINLFKKDS